MFVIHGSYNYAFHNGLFDDSHLSGYAFDVETFECEGTLTGTVSNGEAKSRAAELAASVYGVTVVNNLLKVK